MYGGRTALGFICSRKQSLMLAFYLAAPEAENDRRALNILLTECAGQEKEGRWMCSAPIGYANKMRENGKRIYCPKGTGIQHNEMGV